VVVEIHHFRLNSATNIRAVNQGFQEDYLSR